MNDEPSILEKEPSAAMPRLSPAEPTACVGVCRLLDKP